MQDSPPTDIDLNLAINYLPACLTVFKTAVVIAALETLNFFGFTSGFYFVLMMIFIDRIMCTMIIFDSNVIMLHIIILYYCYHIHLQTFTPIVWLVYGTCWTCFSLYAQYCSKLTSKIDMKSFFVFNAFMISMAPFVDQSTQYRWCRGTAFCFLSLVWVYMIGIHHRKLCCPQDSGVYFSVYFSFVLFTDPVPATVGFILSFCLILFMASRSPVSTSKTLNIASDSTAMKHEDLEMQELQQLLRLAKEQKEKQQI